MGFRQPWHRIARSRIARPARRGDGLPERLRRTADRAQSAYFRGRDPASGWAVRIALGPSDGLGRPNQRGVGKPQANRVATDSPCGFVFRLRRRHRVGSDHPAKPMGRLTFRQSTRRGKTRAGPMSSIRESTSCPWIRGPASAPIRRTRFSPGRLPSAVLQTLACVI